MRNEKVFIILLATLFVMSGILLGTQGINPQTGSINNTLAHNDHAVSNINLGVNITLFNVYINDSYYTNFFLGIINGQMQQSLYADNLYINSSGVLYTNGHSIYLSGIFDNKGHVFTRSSYYSFSLISYGGSGGGARANNSTSSSLGSSTLDHGGVGTAKIHAQNGSAAKFPALNNTLIQAMYRSGFNIYLMGADGQYYQYSNNSNNFYVNLNPGTGSNGLYLQANKIIAGNISSNGTNGLNNTKYNIYTGGGGAGSIILAYAGSNLTAGNVTAIGGKGGSSNKTNYTGGNGGSGTIYNYSYGKTAPISVSTQFHIPVITPEFIFNGSTTSFTMNSLPSNDIILNGNGTYKLSGINTKTYSFNYSCAIYFNGSYNVKSYGSLSYNNSGQNNLVYSIPAFGPHSINLLNAGILPNSLSYMLYGYSANIKLQTGVTFSTPMGYDLTDKLTLYDPVLGANLVTMYIDQKSGVILKYVSPSFSYEVTGTNTPLDHTSAPLPLNDIEIGGGAAAIALVAGVVGYTMMQRRKTHP